MGYEIDFLPVGEGERSGDAIALRYGDLHGRDRSCQRVIVIDGGFEENGERLVEHIYEYYGTRRVDLVVSTHPDSDHIGGLKVVLEKMTVGKLWMHRPWNRRAISNGSLYSGQVPGRRMRDALRRSLAQAHELEQLARSKSIPIEHPFFGKENTTGHLQVLGPTEAFYAGLLNEFRESETLSARRNPTFSTFVKAGKETIKRALENWNIETLTDNGETRAENESSVVMLLVVDGRRLLFTGDAGQRALAQVADRLEYITGGFPDLNFIQVPHHGSRRNVNPYLLDRFIGERIPQGAPRRCSAFVSAAEEGDPKHPAKKVTNAFLRRGAPVCPTQGNIIRYKYNAPSRPGWGPIEPLPLFTNVEDSST